MSTKLRREFIIQLINENEISKQDEIRKEISELRLQIDQIIENKIGEVLKDSLIIEEGIIKDKRIILVYCNWLNFYLLKLYCDNQTFACYNITSIFFYTFSSFLP